MKNVNNTLAPSENKESYIFISYAHLDSERVLPIIKVLTAKGFRVWYDAGIEAGTEWPEYIAKRLEGSASVVAFLSHASVASFNCRQEINYAIDLEKPLMIVYLEELELTGGMRMRLGLSQAMFYYRHPSLESFVSELSRSELLEPCLAKEAQSEKGEIAENQSFVASESDLNVSDGEFLIQNGTLLEYRGEGGEVHIPSGVKIIGHAAFIQTNVTKVTVPSGVSEIGQAAFQSCTELTTIAFPSTLKTVGSAAFLGCSKLSHVDLGEGIISVSNNMFALCQSLRSIVIPESVRKIEPLAFFGCEALEEVKLSLGLEEISSDSFASCLSLETVAIPKTVSVIGARAFLGCTKLSKAYVSRKTKYARYFGRSFPSNTWVIKN